MKLLIVYLSALVILQIVDARPKLDTNVEELGIVDYPAKLDKKGDDLGIVDYPAKLDTKGDDLGIVDNPERVKITDEEELLEHLKNEEIYRLRRNVGTSNINGNSSYFTTFFRNLGVAKLQDAYKINDKHRLRRNVDTNNEKTNFVATFFNNLGKRVNNFLHKEKHSNTQQNNPVNSAKINHKYYSCKIKKNDSNKNGDNHNAYDKIYYDFVKNTKANTYNIFNVTVIHGYHGDIYVQHNNLPINGIQSKMNNKQTNVNNNNTVKPPSKTQNVFRNANGKTEEIMMKKVVKDAECILVGNGCPHGLVRDPSGRFCMPNYAQMEDELFPDEDYE